MVENKSYGWKNVFYNSYEELPSCVGSYDNDEWVSKQITRRKNVKSQMQILVKRNNLLIKKVNSFKKDKINVLDFGGGLGLSYTCLKENTKKELNYHIVETKKNVVAGRTVFIDEAGLSFYTDATDVKNDIDVAYIRTSLQYARDWKSTLEKILQLKPKYLILAHLSAGDVPTYLTLQKWSSYNIPYWFINKEDLVNCVSNKEYNLIFEQSSFDMRDDQIGWSTIKKFPKKYRIEKLLDLVFESRQ